MPLVTTRSIVLQTYRYSDTSKILRLMTREHGPLSALARGALRPKSRFGGLLEPFAEGDATFYLKEGRDLHTLSSFELHRARRDLAHDLGRLSGASVAAELVMRLAPEHRDDRLYGGLHASLDAISDVPDEAVAATVLSCVWQLVATLGFEPELTGCLECGRPIGNEEGTRFDFAAGGVRCGGCSPHGRSLDAAALASLRALATGVPTVESHGPQIELLTDFINYHMTEGARLRSLPFLAELDRARPGDPRAWSVPAVSRPG